jgi:HK97 family phage major capsid protein
MKRYFPVVLAAILCAVSFGASAMGYDVASLVPPDVAFGLTAAMGGSIELIMKSLETVEKNLATMSDKADGELKTLGKVTADTKAALDNIGTQQRELADRLTSLEQKGLLRPEGEKAEDGWGAQLVKSDSYKAFQAGGAQKARIEVKNTLTGADATVAPDRRPGIVPGATNILTIESLYSHIPTASNAIEFTKEASFTNSAAEAAEGAAKAESALTWSLVNMPVSTVAHWIKISRQLAMDNVALAAYVEARMRYGVQRKVETQLVSGDGTAPNISGFLDSGNFTAHGYADAALGTILKKLVLIRKIIGDLEVAGYAPSAIVLNPADWATIEIDLLVAGTSNAARVAYDEAGNPRLFGVPVVKSVGMTADTFAVGDFRQHGNIYDREGVVVQMSESDSDNFTKNLITLRAERRLALTSEIPAAIRSGDLTPA